MYERFTDRARKVMQLANQEAQRFNHEYIGTEHVLLGLIKEGSGVAANVLNLAACLALGLGRWGFPRLEVQGIALATVISRYSMLLAALLFTGWRCGWAVLRLPRMTFH